MPQIDLGRVVGERGERGVSVTGIELAGGTHTPGTTDTYKVTLDNGADGGSFTVYNGKDGPAGAEGPRGEKGEPGLDATVNGHRTVTLAAEGNVELEQRDGALTVKTSAALDAATAWRCNPNLLDNWYFVGGGAQQGGGQFPINQKGETEYSSNGYCIDRWLISSTPNGSVELTKDGLHMSTANGNGYISQNLVIDELMIGRTVTFSVLLADGRLLSATGMVPAVSNDTQQFALNNQVNLAVQIYRMSSANNGYLHPQLRFSGEGATVIAAKLELGPAQTLAHKEGESWVLNEIPDYGTELAKCQRYQIVMRPPAYTSYLTVGIGLAASANVAYVMIPLPNPIRATPVVRIGADTAWRLCDHVTYTAGIDVTAIHAVYIASNALIVNAATNGGLETGKTYFLTCGGGTAEDMILDANL